MALKLKCGSTFASMSSISFARLPERISLSLAMRSTTSSVTVFTSWSGGTSCACSGGTAASTKSAALARLLILVMFCSLVLFRFLFTGRMSIVDEAATSLQVGVALEHIPVERRLLEDAARVQQVGAQLREAQRPQPVLQVVGPHLAHRVDVDVDAGADAVAQV